jgi:hypothetical protein
MEMDDINLIQAVLTEEGEHGRAAARLRLQQAIAAEHGGGAITARRGVPARRWGWTLAGTGLVAAAAAVAVVLGVGAQPASAPRPAGDGTLAAPRTAQEFLLAAATQAAKAPVTTGKYWHTRWDMYYALKTGTPGGDGEPIHKVVEEWQAADLADPSWSSFVTVKDGQYRPEVEKADLIGYGAEAEFNLAEALALPADPAALRAVLVKKAEELNIDLGQLTADGLDGYVFEAIAGLLARAPASPAQRAAAYRLLATVPRVELAGTATDSEGRTGVLLRYRGSKKTEELIVGRETYQVLAANTIRVAMQRTSTIQLVFTAPAWTNEEPTH